MKICIFEENAFSVFVFFTIFLILVNFRPYGNQYLFQAPLLPLIGFDFFQTFPESSSQKF